MTGFCRLWAFGLLMFLAACAGRDKAPGPDLLNPIDVNAVVTPAQRKAILVIGYLVKDTVPRSWSNPAPTAMVSWVRIDPSSRLRNAREMPFFRRFGGCCFDTGTRYTAYTVTPGTYALGWVQYRDNYQPTQFESIQYLSELRYVDNTNRGYLFSTRARAQPIAPTFQIADGEVLYIGDLVLDFHEKEHVHWSFERDDEAAKARLQNTDLAARMVYRAPKRADGAPVQSGDGITFKWY